MSVLLQTPSGDLDITGGQTTLITDPVLAGAQTLRNKFLIFLGEWFLDTRVGWPFFQRVAIKKWNARLISNIVKNVIVNTPPFVSASVVITPPNGARKANISFVAVVDPKVVPGGATVTATSLDQPYIVTVPQVS
jgi:hypothetical protein